MHSMMNITSYVCRLHCTLTSIEQPLDMAELPRSSDRLESNNFILICLQLRVKDETIIIHFLRSLAAATHVRLSIAYASQRHRIFFCSYAAVGFSFSLSFDGIQRVHVRCLPHAGPALAMHHHIGRHDGTVRAQHGKRKTQCK